MPFKRLDYNSGEEVFEIKVLSGGVTSENWKVMKKDFFKVLRILNEKYSLGLIIRKVKDKDLSWAR